MDVYKQLPIELQHKVLLYFKNPICDILLKHWQHQMFFQRIDLLVDLNRYNYFRVKRKPFWDKLSNGDGKIILFDFGEQDETDDWTYKECLQKGWWKMCPERNNGVRLRLALFNTLESHFWSYHGDCDNPETLHHTIYDPLETKKDIEKDFHMRIVDDKGHPSYSYEEWAKRCGKGGSISLFTRRRLKVPRRIDGTWDSQKARLKIEMMRAKNQKSHIRRTWSRWRGGGDEANLHCSYYELCYHQ